MDWSFEFKKVNAYLKNSIHDCNFQKYVFQYVKEKRLERIPYDNISFIMKGMIDTF